MFDFNIIFDSLAKILTTSGEGVLWLFSDSIRIGSYTTAPILVFSFTTLLVILGFKLVGLII